LFYAIVNWARTRGRLRLVTAAGLAAGLFLALFATLSVVWPNGKLPFIPAGLYGRFQLLVADTIHPNVLAGSLALLIPLGLGLLLFAWRQIGWSERSLVVLAVLGMLAIIGLTQSRGAWLGVLAALLLLLLLRFRWGWVLIMLGCVAAGYVFYRSGTGRMLEAMTATNTISSLEGREEIWSRAIYMLQDFPYTGIGMGSFTRVADVLYPFFLFSPGKIDHAHNLFLQVGVDLGIPGLIAWLSLLLLVISQARQLYRKGCKSGDGLAIGIGAGLLGGQVALVVHGLTDAVVWGMVRSAPLVWLLWGLTVAAWNHYIRDPAAA
jgi:putative inorganic carbon (HCO3(-)) transporter